MTYRSGDTKRNGLAAAHRRIKADGTGRHSERINDYLAGYMAGHAAHTREMNERMERNLARRIALQGGEK